jgi:hypothetical protein
MISFTFLSVMWATFFRDGYDYHVHWNSERNRVHLVFSHALIFFSSFSDFVAACDLGSRRVCHRQSTTVNLYLLYIKIFGVCRVTSHRVQLSIVMLMHAVLFSRGSCQLTD